MSLTSSTSTSKPIAVSENQFKFLSAQNILKCFESKQKTVPSSITFPSSLHQIIYITWPDFISVTFLVTNLSTNFIASAPLISYLCIGVISKTPAVFLIAVYSNSVLEYSLAILYPAQRYQSLL